MTRAVLLVTILSLALAPTAFAGGNVQISWTPDPTFGKPLAFTISGSTPGANPNPGYTSYSVEFVLRPATDAPCAQHEYDDPYNGTNAEYQVWDVSNTNGPFALSLPVKGAYPDTPDSIQPGSYRACAWLWNQQADYTANGYAPDHGLIAMQASIVTLREPHFRLSLHLVKPLRLQPFPPPNPHPAATLIARISAEVGRSRALFLTVQPPGSRSCPRNILKSPYWNEQVVYTFAPHLNQSGGVNLRGTGPLTYKLGVALTGGVLHGRHVGARAGRSLLCAGIYDFYDTTAPASEEAAAQTWIKVIG
jgi:hypothetical protein